MKKIPKRIILPATLVVAGLLGGYLYWRFVGCSSGNCGITANWHTSTLMGGLIGYLAGDSINDMKKKKQHRDENNVESAI